MSLERLLSGDTVTVQSYVGESAYGPTYDPAVTVSCRAEQERKLVRNSAGDEVVSEATLYVLPTLSGRPAIEIFAVESLVDHSGRRSQVIGCAPHRGLGAAVYVEVTLT